MQVLLLMGVIYGQDCPIAPQRGLGSQLSRDALVVGSDEWRANSSRIALVEGARKTAGIELAVTRNKYGPGPIRRERWFYPWESLSALTVVAEGAVKLA